MCTLDGAHREEQVWLKSQPGPIDQREQARIKELQRSCSQIKGRSPAHGQTEKPCTFYREGKPCTMPQWSQVKNQTLYWRSSTQSAHTQFYTQWGRSLGKLCLDVNDILYFLTVAKKLWLKCNNLFLSSLAMLNQGSCQKYPLDMIAVTYLKTMHPIFKCTSGNSAAVQYFCNVLWVWHSTIYWHIPSKLRAAQICAFNCVYAHNLCLA